MVLYKGRYSYGLGFGVRSPQNMFLQNADLSMAQNIESNIEIFVLQGGRCKEYL